jgi:hypothetical protein
MTARRRALDLDTLTLTHGVHTPESGQFSLVEAVAYVAGEPWSSEPQCASPVLCDYCIQIGAIEDAPYGPDIRKRLVPYIPRLVDSRGTPAQEEWRGWLALDSLLRQAFPLWLDLAGLSEHATRLRALPTQTEERAVRRSEQHWQRAFEAANQAAWATGLRDYTGQAEWISTFAVHVGGTRALYAAARKASRFAPSGTTEWRDWAGWQALTGTFHAARVAARSAEHQAGSPSGAFALLREHALRQQDAAFGVFDALLAVTGGTPALPPVPRVTITEVG